MTVGEPVSKFKMVNVDAKKATQGLADGGCNEPLGIVIGPWPSRLSRLL